MNNQLNLFVSKKCDDSEANSILSWNMNGITKRLSLLQEIIASHKPSIICLQEIRCSEQKFPFEFFEENEYNVKINSFDGKNGVAIASKGMLENVHTISQSLHHKDGRSLTFKTKGYIVINIYAPNCIDVFSEKFKTKIEWYRSLYRECRDLKHQGLPILLAGDFNLVPTRQYAEASCLEKYPGFLCQELTAAWNGFLALGFQLLDSNAAKYTWWSYQENSYFRDVGMKIDFVLKLPVKDYQNNENIDYFILAEIRSKKETSDHAPILLNLSQKGCE